MNSFTPDKKNSLLPYYEQLDAKTAPGYTTSKSEPVLRAEIAEELMQMDAVLMSIQAGTFDVNNQRRPGWVMRFMLNGYTGEIKYAGFPVQNTSKRQQSLNHVLYTIREYLKAMRMAAVMTPGVNPLVAYLLDESGTRSFAEVATARMLALPEGEKQ